MKLFKKYIPLTIVFLFGIVSLASYYVPNKLSEDYLEVMNAWENIVSAFGFFLGLISLFYAHYMKIKKKVDGWGYSLFVYIGFLLMVVPAIISKGTQLNPDASLTWLGWAFRYLYNPLSATMFSILAFYIISTAYRSFRIKSLQAFVLFAAAFVLILGRIPVGQMIWDSILGFTKVTAGEAIDWIIGVPSTAGKRGIMIGVAIGAVVTSLKIIFGIERQYMGKD
ncbi:MAG: hypothetical protein GX447_02185 [Elusimicrobia bacterium]|nr:hypothetical protein [Elusimicrobiota bacterium]